MVHMLASATLLHISVPSLLPNILLPFRRAVTVPDAGAGGTWLRWGRAPLTLHRVSLSPCLGSSSHHGDVACPRLGAAPPPSGLTLDSVLSPLHSFHPLATSSAEPGGVPGAVHGGQVPRQQAGSEDQGAGDTPGVRKDPSEASGGGFSFACKPSRAALVAGATHAPKEGLSKPGTLLSPLPSCRAS